MKVIREIVFDHDDAHDSACLRFIQETCNQARNFFEPDFNSKYAERVLVTGQPVSLARLNGVRDAIVGAIGSVAGRRPHEAFPVELQKQYTENLKRALGIIEEWRDALA